MTSTSGTVLCLSGHDPTGGAGVQADIETATSLGCWATSVITCLTVQNTSNVREFAPINHELIAKQLEVLTSEIVLDSVKIGLIGNPSNAMAIADFLDARPALPVVLDPILAAGGGTSLASEALLSCIRDRLVPRATLVTPNSLEARRLTGARGLDDCASVLLDSGCQAVLITGAHESEPAVVNRLYQLGHPCIESSWPRLTYSYHGSGCTLAAAAAALLAKGIPLAKAAYQAQAFTWNSLSRGFRLGRGQHVPLRRANGDAA